MFAFRLALALGRTVAELDATMSSAEFVLWQKYSLIEPFGDRRADQRAWLQVAALANANRDPKRPAIELTKVLPEWRPPINQLEQWMLFDRQMRALAARGD